MRPLAKATIKQMRDAEEAQWTREQAIEWAWQQAKWPRRRFRVEGARGGNSRLLSEKEAHRTRRRYGGGSHRADPALDCPRRGADGCGR